MGCASSHLDASEAVAMCRGRKWFLGEAINQRYAMAVASSQYSRSLVRVGESLHRFLSGIESDKGLILPDQGKSANLEEDAGSHIHFPPDSSDADVDSFNGDGDDEDDVPLHSDCENEGSLQSPLVGPTVNFAKSQPPSASETVHVCNGGDDEEEEEEEGDEVSVSVSVSASSGVYPYWYGGYHNYPPQKSNYYPYHYDHAPVYYPGYVPHGEMDGGYIGDSMSPALLVEEAGHGRYFRDSVAPAPMAGKVLVTPPQPSPPKVSWEFLNPFASYGSYYGVEYSPSRSLKDVREEEGIPELEDETEFEDGERGSDAEEKTEDGDGDSTENVAVGEGEENVGVREMEENVAGTVEANVEEEQSVKRYDNVSEVLEEIKVQFDKASGSVVELSKMLEVGKQPYNRLNFVYNVSSRMICGLNSRPLVKDEVVVFEDDKAMGSGNLSSTLQKLYIWEKKLYDEIKAEEKLRIAHDRKCRKMKRLDERGAEAHEIDSTLTAIKKLSTKIKICIQIANSMSDKISKLRDEELWPQISELIRGLMRMWSDMLECHQTQFQAISEATALNSLVFDGNISEAHMEAAKELELELLDWTAGFATWISAQKSYIKALNGWLLTGIRYVPEVTADGVAPFSPGRLGAPPVFAVCNQWAQTIERISEKEVVDAMRVFSSMVLHIWEQRHFEERQKLMANKEMEKPLRIMETEEQEMRRLVKALTKKLRADSLFEHNSEASDMHKSLRQIFEAMENFSAGISKAYEDLHMRVEEVRTTREDERWLHSFTCQ